MLRACDKPEATLERLTARGSGPLAVQAALHKARTNTDPSWSESPFLSLDEFCERSGIGWSDLRAVLTEMPRRQLERALTPMREGGDLEHFINTLKIGKEEGQYKGVAVAIAIHHAKPALMKMRPSLESRGLTWADVEGELLPTPSPRPPCPALPIPSSYAPRDLVAISPQASCARSARRRAASRSSTT